MPVIDLSRQPEWWLQASEIVARGRAEANGTEPRKQDILTALNGIRRSLTFSDSRACSRLFGFHVGAELLAVQFCRRHQAGREYLCLSADTRFEHRERGYQRRIMRDVMRTYEVDTVKVLAPARAPTRGALERLQFDFVPYVSMVRDCGPSETQLRRAQVRRGGAERIGKHRDFLVVPATVDRTRGHVELQQRLALTVPVPAPSQEVRETVESSIRNPDWFVKGQYWSLLHNNQLIGSGRVFVEYLEAEDRPVLFVRDFILSNSYRGVGLLSPFLDAVVSGTIGALSDELLPEQAGVLVRSFVPPVEKVIVAFEKAGFVRTGDRLAEFDLSSALSYQI
jgi:hypothetical protein